MRNLQRTLQAMLATALAVSVAACAPVRVNASLERGMDFTNYKSYAWAPDDRFSTGDPRLDNNEFFQTQLRASADKALAGYGLEQATVGSADLVIHYHASVSERLDVNALDRQYGYCESCHSSVYDAGTITIDFVDARTNALVWRGWAEGSLEGIDDQTIIEQRVDQAVTKVLGQLPPRL